MNPKSMTLGNKRGRIVDEEMAAGEYIRGLGWSAIVCSDTAMSCARFNFGAAVVLLIAGVGGAVWGAFAGVWMLWTLHLAFCLYAAYFWFWRDYEEHTRKAAEWTRTDSVERARWDYAIADQHPDMSRGERMAWASFLGSVWALPLEAV